MSRLILTFIALLTIVALITACERSSLAFLPDTQIDGADASFWGEAAGDLAGFSIASGGDVNGDGFEDILIGASENKEIGNKAGQIYLVFGTASGWMPDSDLANAAGASFTGERYSHQAGFSVASAGDVNGDGFDDILIGAPYYDKGT